MSPMSQAAQNLNWLITNFVDNTPGVSHTVVVSADGLLLAMSEGFPRDRADQLAAVASGLTSLTAGASRIFEGGAVNQTVVEMERGFLFIMSVSDGSSLAVLAHPECRHRPRRLRDGPAGRPRGHGPDPGPARRTPGQPSQLTDRQCVSRHRAIGCGGAAPQGQDATAVGGGERGNTPRRIPVWPGWSSEPAGRDPQNRFNFPSAPSRQAAAALRSSSQPAARSRRTTSVVRPAAGTRASSPCSRSGAPRSPRPRGAHNPLVRPYAMTGGRTRPRYQLAIEALVTPRPIPRQLQGQLPEHQRICHLCREIKSVAEISALLTIPLGVARILVADLAEAGLVAIHQPGGDETAGGQPDVTLLERVLSGLRKL